MLHGLEGPRERTRAVLNLRLDLRIPAEYVPDVHQRMSLYKRVSQLASVDATEALRAEVKDRYGPFPPSVAGLFAYATLRQRAEALGIVQVDATSSALLLRFGPETTVPVEALVAARAALPGSALHPEGLRAPLGPGQPSLDVLSHALEAVEHAAGSTTL